MYVLAREGTNNTSEFVIDNRFGEITTQQFGLNTATFVGHSSSIRHFVLCNYLSCAGLDCHSELLYRLRNATRSRWHTAAHASHPADAVLWPPKTVRWWVEGGGQYSRHEPFGKAAQTSEPLFRGRVTFLVMCCPKYVDIVSRRSRVNKMKLITKHTIPCVYFLCIIHAPRNGRDAPLRTPFSDSATNFITKY